MQQELEALQSLLQSRELAANPLALLQALNQIQARILAKMLAETKSRTDVAVQVRPQNINYNPSSPVPPTIKVQAPPKLSGWQNPQQSNNLHSPQNHQNSEKIPHPYQAIQQESKSAYIGKSQDNLQQTEDSQRDINEHLRDQVSMSLSDNLSQGPVTNLMEVMNLNERFLFVNTLFNQDFQAFQTVIESLNQARSRNVAEEILQSLQKDYAWGEAESEAFARLLQLVNRRFA